MTKQIERFIQAFLKELEENNAVIFGGAGLSAGSGHADWKKLLKEFAEELDLDIEKEDDLISLAQYHLNKHSNNRFRLSQKILNEFRGKQPNVNHEILSRLPISTWWTTNYDRLIEKALENAGKIVDVKYNTDQLANTVHGRSAILYKMHGDVEHPNEAILSKDQYERYYSTHGAFINTLSGDLTSKTFLFIGFSFTDPNLEYILSRIRVSFKYNLRRHYCLLREASQKEKETDEDFRYRQIKQALFIADLNRFNIEVILIKEFSEITTILQEIEKRYKRKTIYISGSAHEYGKWTESDAEKLITGLSKALIKEEYKIVSGFGLGVGSFVINGVLEEVYLNKKETLRDQLLLRPFPQGEAGKELWDHYRQDMISYVGVSIFMFGNKIENDKVVSAGGVRREFEIAKEKGALVIPIGATGYIAKELWSEVNLEYQNYFGSNDHYNLFMELGDETKSIDQLIKDTISFISKFNK